MTYTRVHTSITFANPHLACDQCRRRAHGFHEPLRCGCAAEFHLLPCGHAAMPVDICPSWGPIDGCTCPTPCHEEAARIARGES